ncbi:hypothetical protein PMES_03370, partial [Profundibacterium mesophilum KAUST100406-0324]
MSDHPTTDDGRITLSGREYL